MGERRTIHAVRTRFHPRGRVRRKPLRPSTGRPQPRRPRPAAAALRTAGDPRVDRRRRPPSHPRSGRADRGGVDPLSPSPATASRLLRGSSNRPLAPLHSRSAILTANIHFLHAPVPEASCLHSVAGVSS
ncbi:MAG: hypothetical protein COZ06_05600 [Armatimonadetes bacterium CG_4_10_14_3_um_filter_66_18]|nr:MAG: hypothetical protein COS65_33335 [Armatimonadetes bacterium CG06_land_8_20_14_3_00_66_21]PIW13032.1 MAG: hypothetical protein COW34_11875 [Armatimonadetes bacterium CG17_big_fil_post_rev_8_21_14_2_50_66_6]PIX49132.1 MAG: hypothetical protein COZ57_04200 [Armatimonadetes bacterium CG_4_8_14_3_um_filter_66_20]PIY51168.1 MAG: hypothetical protein COZ06_05600 [Armatimonadetes bacterium CG_4_10_14_3_um_filter_66_18]PIZ30953.1 MAG: hypothetical protein COY42_33270 [Armatimonadetes bacterium C